MSKQFSLLALVLVSSSCLAQVAPSQPANTGIVYQPYNPPVAVQPQVPLPAAPSQPAVSNPPDVSVQSPAVPGTSVGVVPGPTGPGTASEQGYEGGAVEVLSPWDMETARLRESPRQRGEKVEVAARLNGVASQADQAVWFKAWETKLLALGVPGDKIRFEGKRLTKEEFGMWASRQVWAVEAGLITP